jgi:hypothetical protein
MKKTLVPFFSAVFCLLFLIACAPKQVENKEIEVIFNGSSQACIYTGEYQLKPIGVGEYKFKTDDTDWTFIGEAGEKSEITTGTVENMPLVIKHDGKKYETFYSGEIVDLAPVGPIQITDFLYKLEYEGKKLEGLYSGSLFNNLPDGEGEFIYESKGDYFEYSGGWKAGMLSGEGAVESNCFVIHFPDVDREGEYKGEVIEGLPNGQGTFSAINDYNISYKYDGEWADGLFDGKGYLKYNSDEYWTLAGDFTKGDFTPTVADLFVAMGTVKNSEYVVSRKEYDFINAHESYFTGKMQEIDDGFIDKSFKYEEFSKNSSSFELSIIKISGLRVAQVFESEAYGYNSVFIIAEDSKHRVYYINMIGSAPLIVEGSRIQVVALPVDYFTYPNVAGTKIWAIACLRAYRKLCKPLLSDKINNGGFSYGKERKESHEAADRRTRDQGRRRCAGAGEGINCRIDPGMHGRGTRGRSRVQQV